jgi:Putative peptidoglycan binding domain
MLKPGSFFIVLPIFLAACGSTPQDRAITGGGIGAAGGAIIGAVTGLSLVQGVLIGTGLGAAFGGLTTPDKVNFGEPFWKRSNGSGSAGTATGHQEHSKAVADIQRDLKKLGYNTGPVDGVLGPKTKMAIAQFERDQGRAPGQPVDQLAKDAGKLAATPPKNVDN